MRPHRWQPTRLCRPWDSPGKNVGVGCHFLLQCMKVKSESEVAQSQPHGLQPTRLLRPWIFQARVLEWGAFAFSDSFDLLDILQVLTRRFSSKSTGVGCHCLLHKVKVRVLLSFMRFVWAKESSRQRSGPRGSNCMCVCVQSCPTLWDPIDNSPPGSPVPGILQARTLEWVAISFSNA